MWSSLPSIDGFSLVTQSAAMRDIRASLSAKRIVHAYLITGEAGAGKRSFARYMAMLLLCEQDIKPCGVCDNCRRVLADNHPNLHITAPAPKAKSISATQVRELTAESSLRTFERGRKVFIIEKADAMTPQAQNCLLKTLEEPQGDTVIILLAEARHMILPTVQSRCRSMRLEQASAEAIERELLRRYPGKSDLAAIAAAACGGLIGTGIEYMENETELNDRSEAIKVLKYIAQGSFIAAQGVLAPRKADAERMLDLIAQSARDALVYAEGRPLLAADKQAAQMGLDKKTAGRALSAALAAKVKLKRNCSYNTVIDVMLLEILEVS